MNDLQKNTVKFAAMEANAIAEEENRRVLTAYLQSVHKSLAEVRVSASKYQNQIDHLEKILSDAEKGELDTSLIPPQIAVSHGGLQTFYDTRDFIVSWDKK